MNLEEQAAAYRQWMKLSQELEAAKAALAQVTEDRDYWKRNSESYAAEVRRMSGV